MKPLEPLAVPISGTQLVEASAGTGKTHTITTLYVRLLLERQLRPESILVVTFTNAATAELKDRIRARTRSALLAFEGRVNDDPELVELAERRRETREMDVTRLREALRSLDEASVFTIHGFCQRVLAEHAFESGVPFGQELVTEQLPLLLEVVQDFWSRELHPASDAEIQFLVRRCGGFSSLLSLARVALAWPETPIEPESAGASAAPAVAAYVALRDRLAEAWPGARAEVERRIKKSVLHKTHYDPELVCRAFADMDALVSRREASLEGWTPLCQKFTTSYLARFTRKGHTTPEHPCFDLVEQLAQAHEVASGALDEWVLGLMQRLTRFVREEMPRRKSLKGIQSFDDLLQHVWRALRSPTGDELGARLRERHAAALVDEFQDTDSVQYGIFQRVFGVAGSTLFLIGDPKQAIYAFRGADVFAYLEAAKDAAQASYTLSTNYRSDPSLLRATNTLFARDKPFLIDEIGYHPVQPRPGARDELEPAVEVVFLPRKLASPEPLTKAWADARLPKFVAGHVSRLLASSETIDGRPIEPGDIAILTRTNDQARRVQLELRALSIPSVMHGDASVLDTAEAKELARVLAAMADPTDARAVRSALATTLLGQSAAEIDRLQRDEAEWERWMDGFARWHGSWSRQGFVQAFRRLMRDTSMATRLLELVDGDRRLTNVLHLVELLHQEAARRRLGVAGLIQWFEDIRFDRGKREGIASEAQQMRLERDDRAVQLTTMHRAKGLEYPIVYCPFLWTEGGLFGGDKRLLKFHDPEDRFRFKIDIRREKDKKAELELADREARSESLRLAYVALTRARHRTIVCWGVFRQTSSPLGYLLHPPRPDDPRAAGQKLSALDDDRILADLDRLTAESGRTVRVNEIDTEAGLPYENREAPKRMLAAKTLGRRLARVWRSSSFSALSATEATLSVPAVVGRDVDEAALDAPLAPAHAEPVEPVTLHAFPRGARAGDLIHLVLEELDFQAPPSAIEEIVSRAFDRHGFDPSGRESLSRSISEVLETPLGSGAPRLRDVPAARRLSELEFVFPVAHAKRPLSAAALAEVIERHRPAEISAQYPARVARLGFEPLSGFLRGFIDLVFEHDGKFFVVDYKSNHLGPRPDDYRAERLGEVMEHHHYHLQYLLYCVAVHRHLARSVQDYDYDCAFGGAAYLFLRGMHPSRGSERGVFFSRPSRALVEALSELLSGGPR